MSLFHIFFPKRTTSASVAKERLQLVLAHERAGRDGPDFLPALQKDLLAVVAKYFEAKDDMIAVKLGRTGTASVLEINVELGAPVEAARLRAAGASA
jgi:cell division topological specificity factor